MQLNFLLHGLGAPLYMLVRPRRVPTQLRGEVDFCMTSVVSCLGDTLAESGVATLKNFLRNNSISSKTAVLVGPGSLERALQLAQFMQITKADGFVAPKTFPQIATQPALVYHILEAFQVDETEDKKAGAVFQTRGAMYNLSSYRVWTQRVLATAEFCGVPQRVEAATTV